MLRISTQGHCKPFGLQAPDGAFEGIDVDRMASLTTTLGARPAWIETSWASLLPDMVAGNAAWPRAVSG